MFIWRERERERKREREFMIVVAPKFNPGHDLEDGEREREIGGILKVCECPEAQHLRYIPQAHKRISAPNSKVSV